MAITKKRSSAVAAVSPSMIEQASSMLQDLPEKPRDNWSLREAVNLLQDSITAALDRGYTYEEVAVFLGEKGVKIAAPSLKRYLAAVKREKGATKSKPRRQRQPSTLATGITSLKPSSSASETAEVAKGKATKAAGKTTGRAKATTETSIATQKKQVKTSRTQGGVGSRSHKKTRSVSS